MVLVSHSRKASFDKLPRWVLSLNKFSTKRSIVSCKGMLVNSDSISKMGITILESKLWSSSANVKESLIVYSLVLRPSVTILWILAEPCIIPGLESEGLKSLRYSIEISFLSLRFWRTSATLILRWFKILSWST